MKLYIFSMEPILFLLLIYIILGSNGKDKKEKKKLSKSLCISPE